MAYKDPELMTFHILHFFGGKDPSVGLPQATVSERKYWAQHWWEREVLRGRDGDIGFIMDIYPDGTILFKNIVECYKDGIWETKRCIVVARP